MISIGGAWVITRLIEYSLLAKNKLALCDRQGRVCGDRRGLCRALRPDDERRDCGEYTHPFHVHVPRNRSLVI